MSKTIIFARILGLWILEAEIGMAVNRARL